jgi:hypothetical protein
MARSGRKREESTEIVDTKGKKQEPEQTGEVQTWTENDRGEYGVGGYWAGAGTYTEANASVTHGVIHVSGTAV